MAMKYAGDSALRYFKTKLVALINAAKSAADTAQTTANNAASAATTAQSTANSAVSAANANTATLGNKVDKISGKGLSTNDYTTTEKNKLAGIASGANNYSLPTANSTTKGGVKLYDGTASTADATSGWAATPAAVKSACDLANEKTSMVKLWTNVSPTSNFAAQSINLGDGISQYQSMLVVFRRSTTNSTLFAAYSMYDYNGMMSMGINTFTWRQFCRKNSDNTMTFYDAYNIPSYGGSPSKDNTILIPYQIYGIKGVQI